MANIPRILFVSSEFPPGPGGIGNQAFNVVQYLHANGYHIDVLTISDFMSEKEVLDFDAQNEFQVHRFVRHASSLKNYRHRLKKANEVVKSGEYDLVICSGRFSIWLGAYLKFRFGVKLLAITHGGDVVITNNVLRRVTHACLKRYDTVSSVSAYTASKLPTFSGNKQRRVVINNGIDLREFEVEVPSRAMKGSPSLITVGNLWFRKGQQNVIAALPEIIKDYPSVHYHCVGLKSEEERINKQIMELGVQDYVTLHGKVDRDDLISMNKSSDIFMMLSVASPSGDFEGFGIAILEANALGTPAIGALGSGIEDAISNGENGYLVEPLNTHQIAEAVRNILNKKEAFKSQSLEFADKFSWDIIIKQYLSEVERLLN